MSAPTVPISEPAYHVLQELASHTGQTTVQILDQALDAYRRKVFLDQLNAGYAALRSDPSAWAEELNERQQWDAALMDGLDPGERWTEDGRCINPDS